MKIKVDTERTIGDLIDLKKVNMLQVDHEYQRGLRWTVLQKCMFVDSILRGYSVPAFYFHQKKTTAAGETNTFFYVVDGQQRIDAIHSYSENAYPLLDFSENSSFRFPNFLENSNCPWGGKRFSELDEELQNRLKGQPVVIYQITTDNENEIRDLFIRLQGGTPLTPQDKRDSWPGNFTEFVLRAGGKSGVDRWFGLPLFKEVAKVSNESRRRQLVAQIFMLFWTVNKEKRFCDIKSRNLDEFYHSQVGFDESSNDAGKFERICAKLYDELSGKPKVVGHHLIHLFLLVDALMDQYVPTSWSSHLVGSLHEFAKRCKEAASASKNDESTEYGKYHDRYGRWTHTQSDNASTIQRRHAFFSEEMLKLISPIKRDPKRSFTELERETVFFRDMELCQHCRMNGKEHKTRWDECELHHIVPHSEGGETAIDNAALVHRDCHPKAQSDVAQFREWWSSRNKPMDDF